MDYSVTYTSGLKVRYKGVSRVMDCGDHFALIGEGNKPIVFINKNSYESIAQL